MQEFFYLFAGFGAGLLGGLFGLGGGLLLVPVLLSVFGLMLPITEPLRYAVGTSAATVALNSLVAVIGHARRGAVVWPDVFGLLPTLALGGLIAASVAMVLPEAVLRGGFVAFLLVVAWRFYRPLATAPGSRSRLWHLPAGASIGAVSALLGIGGGTMLVPYLCWHGRRMIQAIGSSSGCGVVIGAAAALGYARASAPDTYDSALGFVVLPAFVAASIGGMLGVPVGVRLAHAISQTGLRRAFAVVLSATAAILLLVRP